MILQSLADLYDRLADDPEKNIPPYGFTDTPVSWRLVIADDGELLDVQDVRQPVTVRKTTKLMAVSARVPDCGVRTSGVSPNVLCDGVAYVFGYVPEGKKPDPKREHTLARARECFEAFRTRHLELEPKIAHPSFSAVCRFLERWNPDEAATNCLLADNWDDLAGSNIVFRRDGDVVDVHRISEVREAWLKVKTAEDIASSIEGPCLVSGKNGLLERVHSSIKGVRGAQATGAAVVSFNASAFTSYSGRNETQWNAPVGKDAAFKYTTMLNWLLRNENHRCVMIGDASTVFWCGVDSPYEAAFSHVLNGDFQKGQDVVLSPGEDADTLVALRSAMEYLSGRLPGLPKTMNAGAPFFILGLSPNAARISVRFWYAGTLGQVYENLKKFYDDLRIERQFGEGSTHPEPEFPAIWQLLDETVPRKNGKPDREKISPLLSGALARAQLTGGDFPQAWLSAIQRRISADRVVNYMRASGIKAVLTRNYNFNTDLEMLNTKCKDIAYVLGRLFAVMDTTDWLSKNIKDGKIQKKNDSKRKTPTIRDNYYTSASTTPAVVFGRLESLHVHHVRKIRSEGMGGLAASKEKQIADIKALIDVKTDPVPGVANGYPIRLSLQQQGLFSIGYYHQRFASKEDREASDDEIADNDSGE